MQVALVSLQQIQHDRAANFERCSDLVREATELGADIAIFPEMTLTGYSTDVVAVAEPLSQSESLEKFAGLSREFGIPIIFGACLRTSPNARPYNVLCHADPKRGASPVYRKIHPFSFAGEDRVFQAGEALGYLDLPEGRWGASICYDLRFPGLYSAMAPDCDGVICIANWPASRVSDWRTLLSARAIENQLFVIGVNRVGSDGTGMAYEKSSIIVSPDGQLAVPLRASLELDLYHVDAADTQRCRLRFPTVRDSRTSLYSTLATARERQSVSPPV